MIGARRLAALRALAAGTVGSRTPEHACGLAATALEQHRKDMPFAFFYLLDATGTRSWLAAAMGVDAAQDHPTSVRLGSPEDRWDFAQALHGSIVVDVGQHDVSLLPDAPWPEPCRQAMVMPAGDGGEGPAGLLVAGLSPRRPLEEDYATWLELVSSQLGHALATAEARERDRSIAVTLQRSLLPETLPRVEGVALEARYRPALEYAQVGGDWYDAVWVDEDHLSVVVGDVMGKGARAAATMGRLRSAAWAYATLGLSPASVLEELNRLAVRLGEVEFATVLSARYECSSRAFVFASAGHLPPVLVRQGEGTGLVESGLTVPLGVADGGMRAPERKLTLARGEAVLLYTDGLLERRDQDLGPGLSTLVGVCASHRGDLSALLDAVMEQVAGPESPDDIAMLALGREA